MKWNRVWIVRRGGETYMTTIVNNPTPAPANETGGGMGMIIGLVVVLVLGYLFIMYGVPALRQMQFGSPQINIPSKIDVNVTQTK